MKNYKEIIDKLFLTKVSLKSVEEKDDYDILTIYGGFNGNGNFDCYLDQVKDIVDELQFEGDVWLIDWINDCPDDVWTLRIGVRK